MHYLSKSRLISGWQCAKRLWLETNQPDDKQFSAATEASFAVGHRVGRAAQQQFPGGILIGHDRELGEALRETEQLLAEPGPVTLFEATFQHDGVLIRADVLTRNVAGQVRLIEVKSATRVKDHYLHDCAIQLWVLLQSGLDVARVELAHINKQFVYPGNGDYTGLFSFANVTAEARELLPSVPRLIDEMRDVLSDACPSVPMGAQCTAPFDCPFIEYCRVEERGAPAEMPVAWLPGGATAARKLEAAGYRDIREIPEGYLTNTTAERCRRVTVAGVPELKAAAAAALAELGWPRYYFDFETLAPAVPRFIGTRPYSLQPFQWSCHIEQVDGELTHCEFLYDPQAGGARVEEPPMRACAEALLDALGDTGPVFMYTAYERDVLVRLSALFPHLAAPLEAVIRRLVDLHPITKRSYYHPDMRGSWSIKKVLPTVAPDLSYAGLDIVSVGTDAELAFLEMLDPATLPQRAVELRAALLRYCKLDTEAMVRVARFLEGR